MRLLIVIRVRIPIDENAVFFKLDCQYSSVLGVTEY